MLENSKRPLFWLGHGIRLAGAVDLIEPFLDRFKVPVITSWQGKDMLRHDHPRFYGHAGVYGHPVANKLVQNADLIIAIGTRLALPQTGYNLNKFAPNAHLIMVDIDAAELEKIGKGTGINRDAKEFMLSMMKTQAPYMETEWEYPYLVKSEYPSCSKSYLNPYWFMEELNKWLKPDHIIVTDMGTALLTAYPLLNLNGKQRLITSTGLGEMGFGLPAAVGASIAIGKGEVLCLNCDGGMMFNLQELATIKHHKLPIKIIVFCNNGYRMISHTQDTLGMNRTASSSSDLSFPNWHDLAKSFGIEWHLIEHQQQFNSVIPYMQNFNGPMLVEVIIDPDQKFGPKLSPVINTDGSIYSPGLEEIQ